MSLKRARPFGSIFPTKKRSNLSVQSDTRCSLCSGKLIDCDCNVNDQDIVHIADDTKAALLYIKSLYSTKDIQDWVPHIILKHQLYSIVKDKTIVDRQLNEMWEKNEVRLFKLISGSDEFAVVLTQDYETHLRAKMDTSRCKIAEKFLTEILPNCIDVSFSKTTLIDKHKLTEDDITYLIKMGILAVRDVGSWWLSIPGVGVFMKNFIKGRKAITRILKTKRYKEILLKELESRSLANQSKLGIMFHIHDIIGAEIVKSIETTSGQLLRLTEP